MVTIASGKGGVGKSTISLNLALALAERGHRVGLLDADLYGPDIPLMIGLTRQERLRPWDLWRSSGPVRLEPVERFGIRVMSAGFLLGEDQALAFAAPLVQVVLHQLLTSVAWGELDELLVDLPSGTADLQQQLLRLARAVAPALLAQPGVGPVTAAQVLISWSHPGRLRSEAAFAMLAGAAPIEASSGRVVRHRLNRGGDRQPNRALHTIVLIRERYHEPTKRYVARRTAEGKSEREIRRCLKRTVARQLFRLLERQAPSRVTP